MKSLNDSHNNASETNNNWLGFSLSPHMKMEDTSEPQPHHHQFNHQAAASSSAVPTSFCLSSPHFNSSNPLYFGLAENSVFHSPLCVMPLKSDGSLCIMEALSRSQTEAMGPNSFPKLENFLGGATMAGHEYGGQDRDAALSLDSIFYTQTVGPEPNRQPSLDLLQDPIRQGGEIQVHQHRYYCGVQCHDDVYQAPINKVSNETELASCDTQIPAISGDELPCLKNWVTGPYTDHHALDQQINTDIVGDGGASGSTGAMGCGDLQSLSLSMSPGSQSSCVTAPRHISSTDSEFMAIETKKRSCGKVAQKQPVHRKSIDTFGQRTSQYRGVTRHRWTGRYEAHLWDNSCKKEGQTRKGRQVYLGGYDMEQKAARAYDLAALKYWGPSTHINFPLENYQQEIEEMKNMSRQEYVAHLRRRSSGFSRGASMYRGVTRHHQHGRWQARIGRVAGNKDLYLGTFSTQEEAAEAYDIAAIKFRGVNAVTNFDISRYDVERIMASNTLLTGELARRNKGREPNNEPIEYTTAAQKSDECVQTERGVFNEKLMKAGNYPNASFSSALQDFVGMDSGNSIQPVLDESAKFGTRFSNSSSLVTSLNSSREASPDRSGASVLLAKHSSARTKFINPTTTDVNPWIPSAQLRPVPISMTHLPVFAAWGGDI